MVKLIGLYITLFWSLTSNAQYLSARGDFSIDQRRGCRDLLLTVTNINPGTDVILYQFEGTSSTVTANTSYTYTTTGNYWLYQYIQGPTGQKVDSVFVEIFDPVVPDFELHACNNLAVQVQINNNDYDLYEIDYGDGTIVQVPVNTFPPIYSYVGSVPVSVSVGGLYTTASNRCGSSSINFTPVNQVQPAQLTQISVLDEQSLKLEYNLAPNTITSLEVALNNTNSFQLYKYLNQGTTTDTLINLQLVSNTYCFRIASHNACSNQKVYSNELCSIYANANAANKSIDLSWNTVFPLNHSSTEIVRDDISLSSILNHALLYEDLNVICKNAYCYFIQSHHVDGSISISNMVCADAFSNTPPETVKDISVHIGDNTSTWSWLTPLNEQVQFFKVFNQLGVILDNTALNTSSIPFAEDTALCINIELTNICDNTSILSNSVCSINLSKTLHNNGVVALAWTAYQGWQNDVSSYSVVVYDDNFNMVDSLDVGNITDYEDPLPTGNIQISYYRIWAIPNDIALVPSSSNLVKVERPPIIAIPSSFTPNGDHLNDVFSVTGKYLKSVELSILNRWGATIYQVNGSTWDGTSNGKKVPMGNYIYQIIIKDFAGNEHIRSGTILILKD